MACSVNRRETVSLFKFPIKSLMIPFELNWPVSLITIYILYVIITPDILSEQHICALFLSSTCTQDCNQCFVLFAGSVHSMCNDAQSRLAAIPEINIWLSDRTGRLWWVTEQNKDGAKCGCAVLEGRSTPFFIYIYIFTLSLTLAYHFNWQTVSNSLIFLCDTFPTVLTARC